MSAAVRDRARAARMAAAPDARFPQPCTGYPGHRMPDPCRQDDCREGRHAASSERRRVRRERNAVAYGAASRAVRRSRCPGAGGQALVRRVAARRVRVGCRGGNEPFARLADSALRVVLAGASLNRSADEVVGHVLSGFSGLGVHPDVPEGVRILRRNGLRLVTLTNGSADVADGLLTRAGLRGEFERLLSVEDAAAWKAAQAAYAHAARACSVSMEQMLLVAVHPWESTARTKRACAPDGSPGRKHIPRLLRRSGRAGWRPRGAGGADRFLTRLRQAEQAQEAVVHGVAGFPIVIRPALTSSSAARPRARAAVSSQAGGRVRSKSPLSWPRRMTSSSRSRTGPCRAASGPG